MKVKVTDQGVVIPKTYLEGITDIDPISELGKNPVECGASDASEKHDQYIYSPAYPVNRVNPVKEYPHETT